MFFDKCLLALADHAAPVTADPIVTMIVDSTEPMLLYADTAVPMLIDAAVPHGHHARCAHVHT